MFGRTRTYLKYCQKEPRESSLSARPASVPCDCTRAPWPSARRPRRLVRGVRHHLLGSLDATACSETRRVIRERAEAQVTARKSSRRNHLVYKAIARMHYLHRGSLAGRRGAVKRAPRGSSCDTSIGVNVGWHVCLSLIGQTRTVACPSLPPVPAYTRRQEGSGRPQSAHSPSDSVAHSIPSPLRFTVQCQRPRAGELRGYAAAG